MKLFISGIEGFAGRYLATEAVRSGFEVSGIAHRRGLHGPNVHQCSLLDLGGLQRILSEIQPDYVAHLAAVSAYLSDDVAGVYETNVLGSRNLLEAVASLPTPPKRVLLVSSGNVYDSRLGMRLAEDTPLRAITDYSVSKIAMEQLAHWWGQFFEIAIARPFNHIGIGQKPDFLIPKLLRHFQQRSARIELGNLAITRDFSDVRDVAQSYLSILRMPGLPHSPINVCTGVGTALGDILTLLQRLTGHAPEIIVREEFTRKHEILSLVGNPSLLESLGGVVPKTPLVDCLNWMLQNGCSTP
jgi:nucleoside-diphosphate-sugar epimerase